MFYFEHNVYYSYFDFHCLDLREFINKFKLKMRKRFNLFKGTHKLIKLNQKE